MPGKTEFPKNEKFSAMSSIRADENRALQTRRDNDKHKDFSITLLDIDTTILSHLDKVVNPEITDNGEVKKVPISFASPEKWVSIQTDGLLRDVNGKVVCPAITIRRTTLQRNDNLATLNRYLSSVSEKKYSEKNRYDKFNMMHGVAPRRELYQVTIPDQIVINYDFIVWTERIEQQNSIVERINFSTDDYWGERNRYKFRTSITDYQFNTEVSADGDRMVKCTFSMMVHASLLPERTETNSPTTRKILTPKSVISIFEVSDRTTPSARIYDPARLPFDIVESTVPTIINELSNGLAEVIPGTGVVIVKIDDTFAAVTAHTSAYVTKIDDTFASITTIP